jgi:hypothetical protein
MTLFKKALAIATEKVASTIFNIVIFRNVYSFVQLWLSGVPAFMAVIYVTPYVKRVMWQSYEFVKRVAASPTQLAVSSDFNENNLKVYDTSTNPQATLLLQQMTNDSRINLFTHIFTTSSKSSLLNLLTIIGVEHLHSSHGHNIVAAILYCVSVTFVICFAASLRYSSLLSREWSESLLHPSSSHLIVYGDHDEPICLWTLSQSRGGDQVETIDLKFLSSKYSPRIVSLFEAYVKSAGLIVETRSGHQDQSSQSKVTMKTCDFIVSDYYDDDLVYSGLLVKSHGFKLKEEWKEFGIFPFIDLKTRVYTNGKVLAALDQSQSGIKKEN